MKRHFTITLILVLLSLQGCINATKLNPAPGVPKLILPGESKSSYSPSACLLSIGVTDKTTQRSAPTPSVIFFRKDGEDREYAINSVIDQGGIVGMALFKSAPSRVQKTGCSEQLLLLDLCPGNYWITGIAFAGYSGRTTLSREQTQFSVKASGRQYIGRISIVIEKRDRNLVFGDSLHPIASFDKRGLQSSDVAWAAEEYDHFPINEFSVITK